MFIGKIAADFGLVGAQDVFGRDVVVHHDAKAVWVS